MLLGDFGTWLPAGPISRKLPKATQCNDKVRLHPFELLGDHALLSNSKFRVK